MYVTFQTEMQHKAQMFTKLCWGSGKYSGFVTSVDFIAGVLSLSWAMKASFDVNDKLRGDYIQTEPKLA